LAYQFGTDLLGFMNDHVIPDKVADQIGDVSPGLSLFLSSGRTETETGSQIPRTKSELLMGGKKVRRTLRHTRATARGSFAGYDILDADPNRKYDAALQEMIDYYVGLSWNWDEELAARGKEYVVNKLTADMDGMVADMLDLMATGIYNSAASRTGMQLKGLHGLRNLCDDDRTWWGIDSTGYPWWDPGFDNTTAYSVATTTDPTHANHILKLLRSGMNNCSAAGTQPTHILTTQTIWGFIEDAIRHQQRYTGEDIGDIGFTRLRYHGAEIYWDSYCPAKHIFFVNQKGIGKRRTLGIVGRENGWFHLTDWREPHNQMAKSRYLVNQCILYCDNPRLQGAYKNIAES